MSKNHKNHHDNKKIRNTDTYKCCDSQYNPFMSVGQPMSSRAVTEQSKLRAQREKEEAEKDPYLYRQSLKYFQENANGRIQGLNRLMDEKVAAYIKSKESSSGSGSSSSNSGSKYNSSGSGSGSSKRDSSKKGLFN